MTQVLQKNVDRNGNMISVLLLVANTNVFTIVVNLRNVKTDVTLGVQKYLPFLNSLS